MAYDTAIDNDLESGPSMQTEPSDLESGPSMQTEPAPMQALSSPPSTQDMAAASNPDTSNPPPALTGGASQLQNMAGGADQPTPYDVQVQQNQQLQAMAGGADKAASNAPNSGSMWTQILQGALAGLAGQQQRGRSSFANGMIGGAKGAEVLQAQQRQQQQQDLENQQNQQKLTEEEQTRQIQNANGLLTHSILATNYAKLTEPIQQKLTDQEVDTAETQKSTFNNQPVSTFKDRNAAIDDATARNAAAAQSGNHFDRYMPLQQADGTTGVFHMSNQKNSADIPFTMADGTKITIPKDTMDADTYTNLRVQGAKNIADEDLKKQAQEARQAQTEATEELARERQDRADQKASGEGQQTMFKSGVNPVTGERLSIANAPDEAMVDLRTGIPVPTDMNSTIKPDLQERNRADFSRSALHTLDDLESLQQQGKLPNGPLKGLTKQQLAKAGMGDADAQRAINDISLMQSASTGAHVGGRFSVPVLQKMQGLLDLNMNDSQLSGAIDSVRNVLQPYIDNGRTVTAAEYRAMDPAERARLKTSTGGYTPPVQTPAQPKTPTNGGKAGKYGVNPTGAQ